MIFYATTIHVRNTKSLKTGSFAASTLGVSVLAFLPFTFFSLLCPVFSILSGITGIGLKWQKKAA